MQYQNNLTKDRNKLRRKKTTDYYKTKVIVDKSDYNNVLTPILFDKRLFLSTEDRIGDTSGYLVIFLKENIEYFTANSL